MPVRNALSSCKSSEQKHSSLVTYIPGTCYTNIGGFRLEVTIQNRATHCRLLRVLTYITAFSCCGMHALPLHGCGNTSYRAVWIHSSSPVRILNIASTGGLSAPRTRYHTRHTLPRVRRCIFHHVSSTWWAFVLRKAAVGSRARVQRR